MEKIIITLLAMAAGVLLVFFLCTWGSWRLLRWSRQRPGQRSALGIFISSCMVLFCAWMISFRWNFRYDKTVNGQGTHIHVQLGWLFLLPLTLALAAIVIWVVWLRNRPSLVATDPLPPVLPKQLTTQISVPPPIIDSWATKPPDSH